MRIKAITIGGFKNLKRSRLQLDNTTIIASPNNYGKSNLLEAINFGVEFIKAKSKDRKSMMRWVKGIPINSELENDEFFFEIEFENQNLTEYRFGKYGFTFSWYKDDKSGQKITGEWIEARANESVRYTSFLKREAGLYRKEKNTSSFRKINIDEGQLAIDVLVANEEIEIQSLIKSIVEIDYHICSSLDLGDRFQPTPIEYIADKEDGLIAFDDNDVPRAIYQLKKYAPEKYNLFLEAVYHLFPEFTDIAIQSYTLNIEKADVNVLVSQEDHSGKVVNLDKEIPFRIRDELYRVIITSDYLNQPINISMMSTGTKRIFWLLVNIFIASSKGMSFIGVEELETSIHPRLLKGLLEILDESMENTSLIISSHSPFLVQYIKADKIYIGVPNNNGTAEFKRCKQSKLKYLVNAARDNGMSVGEYLFDLMSGDGDSAETLSFYVEE